MENEGDNFLGVFEEPEFSAELEKLIPDEERRDAFLAGITFLLSHEPLMGQLTDQAGILGLPSIGIRDVMPALVVYYSFDAENVTLQEVKAAH